MNKLLNVTSIENHVFSGWKIITFKQHKTERPAVHCVPVHTIKEGLVEVFVCDQDKDKSTIRTCSIDGDWEFSTVDVEQLVN